MFFGNPPFFLSDFRSPLFFFFFMLLVTLGGQPIGFRRPCRILNLPITCFYINLSNTSSFWEYCLASLFCVLIS